MKSTELPLVTVVTVCFNLFSGARTGVFRQCLESVRTQDYPRLEHLVVDGASQDGTVELLEQYARQGWIRFVSEPDSGIYDAMNKGIQLARGKYIAFLNSDDFWNRRDAVSVSVAALERSSAAFSYAPRTIVNEDGSVYCKEAAGLGVFPCLMPFCHQTMFTRRSVLMRFGGFDAAHYRSAADYDLVCRLLLGGERGVYVPVNFTCFRLGGFSVAGEELSLRECRRIRRRLLGRRAAELLQLGRMDDDLMLRILENVHPRVAMEVLRCFHLERPGSYLMSNGLVRRYPEKTEKTVIPGCSGKVSTIYLLTLIPVLQCKQRPSRTDWLLFSFFPLLRMRKRGRRTCFYLLFVLPVLSLRYAA